MTEERQHLCALDGKTFKHEKQYYEHMGENIHAKYNRLEKKHQNQKNRGKRFFLVIRDLVDENRCDRKHLKKRNNVRRRLV